jgi:hypothetical protein
MSCEQIRNIVNAGKEKNIKGMRLRSASCCLHCRFQCYDFRGNDENHVVKCGRFGLVFGPDQVDTNISLSYTVCDHFATCYITKDESHFKSALYHLKLFVMINVRRLLRMVFR